MTTQQALSIPSLELLQDFISPNQLAFVQECLFGEEAQFFINKMNEIADFITSMPSVIDETDEDKFYLHYFQGNMDWFISKKDIILDQRQAYGYADLGFGCGELGTIPIKELLENNIELDFHFKPCTLTEVKVYR